MTDPSLAPNQPASAKEKRRGLKIFAVLVVLFVGGCAAIVIGAASQVSTSGNNLTGQKGTVTSGGSAGSAKGNAPGNAAVGQPLHVTGRGGLDATITLVSLTVAKTGPGAIAEPPKNGMYAVGKFIIVDTAGSYAFNPFYLKFQTAEGITYGFSDGNSATAGFEPALSSGTLNAGQKTGGVVVFDVPAAHGIVQLTDPLGGVVGQWTV